MTPNANNPRRYLQDLRRPLALAVALALAPFASPVLAQALQGQLPRFGTPASGVVTISDNPGQATPVTLTESTTITQTTRGAIINWGSFDIGAQNTVTFDHQVAGGVTLNRVIGFAGGPTASNILGKLNSPNGSVFLVNPAGIVFGSTAQVNVGGLVASTLGISDADFNTGVTNGHYVFGPGAAHVENGGTITASANGTVALLGSQATNDGTITAPQGTIALGAGSQITLDIGGDGLTQLTINVGANDGNGVSVTNSATGKLVADGGQVLMQAVKLGPGSFASVVNSGLVQARSLQSRGGRIVLSSSADDNNDSVTVSGGTLDASGSNAGVGGGSIAIDGYDVTVEDRLEPCEFVPCVTPLSVLNASGTTGGGTINLNARDVAGIDPTSTLQADASGNGNGGSIAVNGANGLYGFGSYFARGGAGGGNGGSIETSGGGLDLNGIKVDASAPNGTAGVWTIHAVGDVTIGNGSAPGTLPDGFIPLTTTNIQDSDIGNALNNSTSVTVQTEAAPFQVGDVTFDTADIERTQGTAPTTFRIDANGSIDNSEGGGNTIASTNAGAVNIAFDANANSTYDGDAYNGNIDLLGMALYTNGGDVMLYGQGDPVNGYASSSQLGIHFDAGIIDTRVNQADTGAGGNVAMRGVANDSVLAETGIDISGSSIATSTGAITLSGSVATGDDAGVGLSGMIIGNSFVRTSLSTTSGNITLDGTSLLANDQADKWGVRTADADITAQSGTIAITGRAEGTPNSTFINRGVQIGANTSIVNGTGRTLIAGEATSGAAGVEISNTASVDGGSGTVVVQARNDGSGDALVIAGPLASTGTIDLRPGGVDVNGNVTENPNDAIDLGGALGFALDATEMGYITAAHLVLGSDIQAGAITVSAPITYNQSLTLNGGAGGTIAVNGALNVGANTLALIGAGNITQTAAITAKSLLVQSSGGSVILGNTGNNVTSATLAGSAAGDFTFINAGTVGIGTVSATGFGAAGNAPTALSGSGVSGNNVLVRALTGNMILNADVSGGNVELVSAGIFDNAGGNAIIASGIWRVWGNTWTGETRAGLAGNGSLPNLYGCTFGTACTSGITVPASNNHFIYTQRPTLTIGVASATREYGLPNNAFSYTLDGLILGDQANNAVNGSITSNATQASNVGNYALSGNFVSAAGYVVAVTPGTLAVTPATLTYSANPGSRMVGVPNGVFGGSISGFRNDDTQASSTTGTLTFQSPADANSPIGRYAIDGSGLSASNYVFTQASGNAVALTILPPLGTYTLDVVRDTPVTYVYDRNFGIVGLCPATDLASDSRDKDGDTLAREWSRVRSRPNLANCVSTKQKNSCGDF
jgi:filamentous hemagglutinin family protein